MGNPSDHVETPLTGGYLLIVLAEPRSAEHKLAILKRLTKGLLCWNFEESGVDIAAELNAIVNQNIEGEEGKNGEQLFQYASDNLVAEILINPQHGTLVQCVRNLLASFTKYRCIIYTGYSFTENGSWILQDGTFSVADFIDAYKTAEAQRTVRLHENQIRIELHCSPDVDWTQASRVKGTRFVLNPPEKITENESISSLVRWLCDKIEVVELDTLLEGSQVVGNIRFSRPTLYVFPAGQGDSALFGINGFNMLIDGGAGRNACFWGFARHLDRLDAVLLTRLNSTNIEGVASFLKRKTMSSLYPQIGHFFCNFKTRKQVSSQNIDVKEDVLSISLIESAQGLISDLKQLQLRPHLCYRNINLEPINLYHKVGHGKLDMYVLNPSKDSKEVKDFLTKWNEGDQKLFNSSKDVQFPLPNMISICTLLVWQPANPNTTITRILFPGSSPQNKIFEALERVRHLEFLKHPSCSIKSMSSSTTVTIKSQTTKKTVLEKMIPGETKTVKTMENLEVSATASNDIIQTAIIPTVPKEGTPKPKSPVEAEKPKTLIKSINKESTNVKPKVEHKYGSITAKVNSNKVVQKTTTMKKPLKLSSKSPPTDKSSPTTPIENQEKTTKPIKQVIKPKPTPSTSKSPSNTPSKSKKEETNRKVLVSSRTNSGLRRTQTTKKETKPTVLKSAAELSGGKTKKDSNVVYKSSLISGSKDKSGEVEDILIIEKVAITPEKLLTPDGKKIVANELDGILTTAKHMITKEKCGEKLSDSGTTTAPTMPEDEKITESKKEISINEYSDKKVEEFKKIKDSLKTPDEVADLPFHEEVDQQKSKVEDIETVVETQDIVQVEKAEYVLVSSDSSPEVLKRQVLDTVDLLDTEQDDDSDKEDACEETKETKLIEHLLESSKELSEITDKIEELKKQNDHEIIKLESSEHKEYELKSIKEDKEEVSESDLKISSTIQEIENKIENVQENIELNTTILQDQESTSIDNADNHEKKMSSRSSSISNEPKISSDDDKIITQNGTKGRSSSDGQGQEHKPEITDEKPQNKNTSKSGSVCDEQVKSPVFETETIENIVNNSTNSISQEQETPKTTVDKQESKASSKSSSVCEELVKSPKQETAPTDIIDKSRSSSIGQEQESNPETNVEKPVSKASSKASSVCDEPEKSPVHETVTTENIINSTHKSNSQEQGTPTTIVDKQESKASSKSSSVCEELDKSPIHETAATNTIAKIRSSSVSREQESSTETIVERPESKDSSKTNTICEKPYKSPTHEITHTEIIFAKCKYNSIDLQQKSTTTASVDNQESKDSSRKNSVCKELDESPKHETVTTDTIVTRRSSADGQEYESNTKTINEKPLSKASSKEGSISDEREKSPTHEISHTEVIFAKCKSNSINLKQQNTTMSSVDNQEFTASSKTGSVCDVQVKPTTHESGTTDSVTKSRSGSVGLDQESIPVTIVEKQESTASSKTGSVCEEPVKSPMHEIGSADSIAKSTYGSVDQEHESASVTIVEKQETSASSKAGSVCDEPVKSPTHETGTTDSVAKSRSDSIVQDHESVPVTIVEKHESTASSKAGSVCDESVKLPTHEPGTTDSVAKSRSDSMGQDHENVPVTIVEKHESSALSKAGSVCDEPVKSPTHEPGTADSVAKSRSGSVSHDHESVPVTIIEKHESSALSKAGSVSDEPVKSPTHEPGTADSVAKSRSGSVSHDHESVPVTIIEKQESSALSKTGSVCDEPVKSPIHETGTTDSIAKSRSDSVGRDHENLPVTIVEKQESSTSRKAESVCDEPVKSPIHETGTTDSIAKSRSGSVDQEHESGSVTIVEKQESSASSKAGSVCDEPVKSPTHETGTTDSVAKSRSDSLVQDHESASVTIVEKQELSAFSKAGSVCNEPVKSPTHETGTTDSVAKSRSDSIVQDHESASVTIVEKHESSASSKAGSVCDELIKSPIHETKTTDSIAKSRSGSVSRDHENVPVTTVEKQESSTSSKAGSVCDEPVKSPNHETGTTDSVAKSRSDSIVQDHESVPVTIIEKHESTALIKTGSVCDEPVKSPTHESGITDSVTKNRSDSLVQGHESVPVTIVEKQESTASSKTGSVCDEPVKSPIHETGTTDSIAKSRSDSVGRDHENVPVTFIEKHESSASSKAGSICDEPVKSPTHGTGTTDSVAKSRSDSMGQDHESVKVTIIEKQESSALSKAESVCDEPVKSLIHEIESADSINKSSSGSVGLDYESIPVTIVEKQESTAPSKTASVCDEPVKSPTHETVTTDSVAKIRSDSMGQDHESVKVTIIEKQESSALSKAGSVCDEPVKSPTHETGTTDSDAKSRSASVSEDHESVTVNIVEKQESSTSSKAGSVCDEPVKSPNHETGTTDSVAKSRSDSIVQDHESVPVTIIEKHESTALIKTGSVCDEPVKSPTHESGITDSVTKNRSDSLVQGHESVPVTIVEKQESTASSKTGSVCDEPVKSPIHETGTTDSIAKIRSDSIVQDHESVTVTVIEKQESSASSKTGSVCDEPVKSQLHESVSTDFIVNSRSGSVDQEQESTVTTNIDKQELTAASKSGSICEEPLKSPIFDTVAIDTIAKSQSSSAMKEQESTYSTIVDKHELNNSLKAGSVSDASLKSCTHEIGTTDNIVTSCSSFVGHEPEITPKNSVDNQESSPSSKAGSICEEPVKSPLHDIAITDTLTKSRSSSINLEQESIPATMVDKPVSLASSKASSICEEPVKSLIHETETTDTNAKSRSISVHQDQESTPVSIIEKNEPVFCNGGVVCNETVTTENIVTSPSYSVGQEHEILLTAGIDQHESKLVCKSSTVCEENVKSPTLEVVATANNTKTESISDSQKSQITPSTSIDNQDFNASSKVFEESIKSLIHDTVKIDTIGESRSSPIGQEHENTLIDSTEKPETKASSKAGSICDEPLKSPGPELNIKEIMISSRTSSICHEEFLESLPSSGICSVVDESPSISLKEQELISTSLISRNSSICQDTDSTTITDTDKPDSETSCTKESFCHDKNESSIVCSNETKSVFQEQENTQVTVVNNKESKVSIKAHSVGGEISEHEIITKENLSSCRSNSECYDSENQNSQTSSNKSFSIFDDTQKILIQENKAMVSTSSNNISNISDTSEKRVEDESKPLGRIGSMCDEITKFLSEDDKKPSKMIMSEPTHESPSESIIHQSNIEELKTHSEGISKSEDNSNVSDSVKNVCILSNTNLSENEDNKPLKLEKDVQIDNKNDNINKVNKDDCLPITNISVSNIKSPNKSTPMIEETDKTGKMNVAQMVGKNIDDKLSTKQIVTETVESEGLKSDTSVTNITSDKCISKSSTMLIEHAVKTCDEKSIDDDCSSTVSEIGGKQSLGITLNSEDLGVTKDIVMQLKRDVHEALHQCSSDDDRPFTPHSESSMSRSTMNIDDDDDDDGDKNETDDDMPGSPMSTGHSPVPMQLDNRHVEINIDFNKAVQEHRTTRGEDLTTTETNGNNVTENKTAEHDNINRNQGTSSDTVQSWGKPLGLPPVQSINNNGFDPIREWGKPLGLPSPTQPVHDVAETQNVSSKTTPKKNVKKTVDNKPIINVMDKDGQNRIRRSESPSKLRSRSSSRMSRINPVYLDLIYVPHHGNSKYVSADFFKRVRARNYVFSGTDPSKEVLNALIEGKQAWEDQDLEVTIIPTYDTDTLSQWVAENEDLLAKLKIDLSPSASRCTIKLQDHNTSCSAYRLEF